MTRFRWFSIIFVFLGNSSLSIGRIIGVFIELSCDYQGLDMLLFLFQCLQQRLSQDLDTVYCRFT